MDKGLSILILIIIVAVVAVAGYLLYPKLFPAKVQAPSTDPTADWLTYANNYGISFKYPVGFWGLNEMNVAQKGCNYSFSVLCPPAVNILRDELTADGLDVSSPGFKIDSVQKKINGNDFCVYSYSEGAAGTTYKTDYYVAAKDAQCTSIKIVTPYPNCQNYLPLEKNNTEQEVAYNNCVVSNAQKPTILNQIFSTFKFTK